jgi:hypothetical protein
MRDSDRRQYHNANQPTTGACDTAEHLEESIRLGDYIGENYYTQIKVKMHASAVRIAHKHNLTTILT